MSAFFARVVIIATVLLGAATVAHAQVWKPRAKPKSSATTTKTTKTTKATKTSKPETRSVKTSLRPSKKAKPPKKHVAKKKARKHHHTRTGDDFTYTEEDFPSD